MMYVFEDNPDADISKLFQSAYDETITDKFIYSCGNGELVGVVERTLIKTDDTIIVFMDTIPGNKDCVSIYMKLKNLSRRNNFRVVVFNIVCAEYYMLKSLADTGMIKDSIEHDRCINKEPHLTSKIMRDDTIKRFCKNFEKYCKYILKYKASKDCIKPYNKETGINGECYVQDCLHELCEQRSLASKAMDLLKAYENVPSGSKYIKGSLLDIECIWDIHRKLIDEYNYFCDRYIEVDSSCMFRYRKIHYIKEKETY